MPTLARREREGREMEARSPEVVGGGAMPLIEVRLLRDWVRARGLISETLETRGRVVAMSALGFGGAYVFISNSSLSSD